MPSKDAQQTIDWRRADQLAALRLARLPAVTLREGGRPIRVEPRILILVLRTIDDHGTPCWASAATLAAEAHLSERTVFRALAALSGQGVPPLCLLALGKRIIDRIVDGRRQKGWCNTYAVVWTELAKFAIDHPATVADHSAMVTDHPATVARPPCHRGIQSVPSEAPQEAPHRLTSDDGDDERFFSPGERAEIRQLANELAAWVDCRRLDDRELVAKLATLRHAGLLSEDDWQDLLESFERARESGKTIDKPGGWIWARLRDRLGAGRLERLLASCRYPRELMPPVSQGAR